MSINDQAVKAALKKLAHSLKPEVVYPCMGGAMQEVSAALEAAMPHIRKQIAAEALREAADAADADPDFRDPLRLKSDWLRNRAQKSEES